MRRPAEADVEAKLWPITETPGPLTGPFVGTPRAYTEGESNEKLLRMV